MGFLLTTSVYPIDIPLPIIENKTYNIFCTGIIVVVEFLINYTFALS